MIITETTPKQAPTLAEQKQFAESCMRQLFEIHDSIRSVFSGRIPANSDAELTARESIDFIYSAAYGIGAVLSDLIREEAGGDRG